MSGAAAPLAGPVTDVEWTVAPGLVDYPGAVAAMEARAQAIRDGSARELVWLVEHPPLYTAGTSATPGDLLDARFPVFASGRGGKYTYHGPGQRVVYVMLDLDRRGRDVRRYVAALEQWAIAALGRCGVECHVSPGRVGIWTGEEPDNAKIGAIGVRIRRWVTYHGIALNVAPDLGDFGGIVPCGLADSRVTSLRALGNATSMETLDSALAVTAGDFLDALTVLPFREKNEGA